MTEVEWFDGIVLFLIVIVSFAVVFEAVLLGISFFGADKVECNWLSCKFTTIRATRECYENGVMVTCGNETLDYQEPNDILRAG